MSEPEVGADDRGGLGGKGVGSHAVELWEGLRFIEHFDALELHA
ncbi:hypothetical protein EKPJFOCH_3470 [Methylobacterium thuringiense]|uniref:Uncharacterized protein n=1 Tax=Methylobacterium thuringiense TaxID=1003091 RepID=A0ABQ4TTL2_9HYPH|nr:hypothetical protein EKPJFOCH_3470 [Methylobacterium thuringiense]